MLDRMTVLEREDFTALSGPIQPLGALNDPIHCLML